MPTKLIGKALRYFLVRPFQRYNIWNRSQKYLGPDAKYFAPAPRADADFKSITQKRSPLQIPKSFSETKHDDDLVIDASKQLEVTKLPIINNQGLTNNIKLESKETSNKRPLPTSTNLPLQDPRAIWVMDKVPPGRLNLNQLQEIMLNQLGDPHHWTPRAISEKYNLKEEYAESIIKYLKQIRIIVSPKMMKSLDYVGREDSDYQASKHLVYFVDKSLRTEDDKKYDETFLPSEDLDEEVRSVIDDSSQQLIEKEKVRRELIRRPEPLRIGPLNKKLETAKQQQPEPLKLPKQ